MSYLDHIESEISGYKERIEARSKMNLDTRFLESQVKWLELQRTDLLGGRYVG